MEQIACVMVKIGFIRFFLVINISKLTGLVSDSSFRLVPMSLSGEFDHIYNSFNLKSEYLDVISSTVKERK